MIGDGYLEAYTALVAELRAALAQRDAQLVRLRHELQTLKDRMKGMRPKVLPLAR